jgi:hypothetical protein
MIIIEGPKPGDSLDAMDTAHPSKLELFGGKSRVAEKGATAYGYVLSGRAQVKTGGFGFQGDAGTFFSVAGDFELDAAGLVAVIFRYGYQGVVTAGRVEEAGRLAYLNGCSSTVLVPPPRLGDPVLNHLHIPQGIDQTQHTHPSIRLGIVVRGAGLAYARDESGSSEWVKPLSEGCVFMLSAGEPHAFCTVRSPQGMDLVTYHPDSDWGPSDDNHPMLTATLFDNHPQK